jgi:Flp pilus assembly protein TadD
MDPSDVSVKRAMGRCQGKLGNYDRARELLQESRRVIPHDPWALYELGMVEAAAGNETAAREHLEAALTVWRDADPEFKEAREVREKLAEL